MSSCGKSASAKTLSTKKQKLSSLSFGLGSNLHFSLTESHTGKQLLLEAKLIYNNGGISCGKEDHLFQYQIVSINDDCKTAVIEYESKYITHRGNELSNNVFLR